MLQQDTIKVEITRQLIGDGTTRGHPSKIAAEREVAKDQKETFEIGNDSDVRYPEHWPDKNDIPGFKEVSLAQLC